MRWLHDKWLYAVMSLILLREFSSVAVKELALAGLRAAELEGFAKMLYRTGRRAARKLTLRDRKAIAASSSAVGLHLGCGTHLLKGWLNSDFNPTLPGVMSLDATRRFPFPDGTFPYVYSEHLIEHLNYGQGRGMLTECYRVLQPGGRIRISTPDLRFLVSLYQDRSTLNDSYIAWAAKPRQPASAVAIINNFVRDWGHTFIYDEQTLAKLMTDVGFRDVTRHVICESNDTHLRGLENPARMPEGFLALESLILEASR